MTLEGKKCTFPKMGSFRSYYPKNPWTPYAVTQRSSPYPFGFPCTVDV